jgi:hypothetical protein
MNRYGTFPYGTQPYGFLLDANARLLTGIYSRPPPLNPPTVPGPPGPTPVNPLNVVPPNTARRRTTCARIWSFDLENWALGEPLPSVAPGASETVALVSDRWADATLSFSVQDSDRYLDPADLEPLVREGRAVVVVRQVTDHLGNTAVEQSPPYVIQGVPSRSDDFQGGDSLAISAVDRLQYFRTLAESNNGFFYMKGAWWVFDAAAALGIVYGNEGLPLPGIEHDEVLGDSHHSSFLQFLQAYLLVQLGAGSVRALWDFRPSEDMTPFWATAFAKPQYFESQAGATLSGGGSSSSNTTPTTVQLSYGSEGFIFIGSPGQRISHGDMLNWVWGGAPFRMSYGTDGHYIIRPVQKEAASGWAAVYQPTGQGGFYVPWERMELNLSSPSTRSVTYLLTFTPAVTLGGEGGVASGGGGVASSGVMTAAFGYTAADWAALQRLNVGSAVSWNRRFPFRPEVDTATSVVERDVVTIARGFGNANVAVYPGTGVPTNPGTVGGFDEYCRYTLGLVLGQAERIVLTVDSAVTPPELGTTMSVVDRRKGINGTYRLTTLSRPLGIQAATWSLNWLRDND